MMKLKVTFSDFECELTASHFLIFLLQEVMKASTAVHSAKEQVR